MPSAAGSWNSPMETGRSFLETERCRKRDNSKVMRTSLEGVNDFLRDWSANVLQLAIPTLKIPTQSVKVIQNLSLKQDANEQDANE